MSEHNHHPDHQAGHQRPDEPKKKRPLHKHIGHHAKNAGRRVTKYLTERDTMFATVWVFIFIVLLGSIPLNLGIMNPLKLGLKDFDFNDITYSKLGKATGGKLDSRITIINIGWANRKEIADLIDTVAARKPKVMALDALFFDEKDPYMDSVLSDCFSRNKNLIAAQQLILSGKEGDTVSEIRGKYINTASRYAYVNFFVDSLSTVRAIQPFFKDYAHKVYPSFAAAVVQAYDSNAYKKLESKGDHKVVINYSRHLDRYQYIDYDKAMAGGYDDSYITGKIVLFGYINENRDNLDDKFFTPMNERFAGKSIPDMSGIVVHANFISMALDHDYIRKFPFWGNLLLAVIVCWLHMSFFIHYYLESHIWFHLAAKIAQVLSAIFFVWLGIYLYDKYRLKVDMKFSLITIALAVDVIYFYEAWAVWMHRKFGYRTVFKPHHH